MKIIVIGAEGAVGRAVCNELTARHQIIKVGRNSGEIHADIGDRQSIEAMYLAKKFTGKLVLIPPA